LKPKSPRARQAAVWASKIADPAARDRFIELLAEASALSQRAAELRRHAWTLYRSAPPADTPSTNRTPTNA
jgi:hypothetical protein